MEQNPLILPQMLPDFKSKTAVITGAGQGIGRCVALSFAAAG
ncbi:MAG: 2,4-dienoyl-CoA reductase, partial [Clostridiaceae bacterium]|nr:2,4-dienoyl-CoA reductase [Clostridiaceae bacterium]